jgi:hypothetical protein
MVWHKPAWTTLSVGICNAPECRWVDGIDLERQVTERVSNAISALTTAPSQQAEIREKALELLQSRLGVTAERARSEIMRILSEEIRAS